MATATLALSGCATDEPHARTLAPLVVEGPWVIPIETLLAGDEQHVDYTGAGPWIGEEGCAPGIEPGTDILRDYLYAHFPQTNLIGGYDCRPIVGNPSQMSVHGTGRALDIMIPTEGGEADNGGGDPIGNWLIENAEVIGIQYIIWDLTTWQAERDPGEKDKPYGGAHPHHDHLHIELSVASSLLTTNWFESHVSPPTIDGCVPLAFAGGEIDETSPCFIAIGPAEYWRLETSAGHQGGLLWTNAWENDEPSNWATWNVIPSARGSYDVEVYLDPAFGAFELTRYEIQHGGQQSVVHVDQGANQGWVSLGVFDFEPGAGQSVSVFDNADAPVSEDAQIVVDAIRLTRQGDYESPATPDPGSVDDPADPNGGDGLNMNPSSEGDSDDGRCSVSATSPPRPGLPSAGWLLLGLVALFRRKAT